jgi:hypothetical protein
MQITDSLNDQLMCMAAHRHCLGRASYVVSSCLEWLRDNWDQFNLNTQNVILRDTAMAIYDDMAGMDMDKNGWIHFLRWAWPKITDDQRNWIRRAVDYKDIDIDLMISKED